MDPEPNRFLFIFSTFIVYLFSTASYADQYYDPQTRRYIEVDSQQTAVVRQKTMQRAVPTVAEINTEKQRVARQIAYEAQAEEEARNSSSRRFDPNRFHRTEDVGFY